MYILLFNFFVFSIIRTFFMKITFLNKFLKFLLIKIFFFNSAMHNFVKKLVEFNNKFEKIFIKINMKRII